MAHAQTTVLSDPFTHTGPAAGQFTADVNANLPGRQSAGLLTTTFTKALSAGAEANLEESSTAFSNDDVINLRTAKQAAANAASIAVQPALKLDTNFGPQLAGRKWQVSFQCRMLQNNASINDAWTAISIGDGAATAGPNNAAADIGMLVRYNKGYQVFLDNVVPAGGNGTFTSTTATAFGADFWGATWTLTVTVDESVSPASLTAKLTAGAAEQTIGPWTTSFENATTRTLEVRAHQGGVNAAPAGALMDSRINDLRILVTTPPAVPEVLVPVKAAQTVWAGDDVALSVQGWGAGALSYAWSLNGSPVPGANTATLNLPAVTLAQGGSYTATITNANGSVTSTGTLNVIHPTAQQRTYEPMGPSNRRGPLVISEIHYNPAGGPLDPDLEFVEIHNTDPWPEDLGLWQLSGEIGYTFPAGTVIPANSYLVVAAQPAAVQSHYGITGVLGPWTGSLSNAGGELRLRKKAGAVAVDASYSDGSSRWPIAADGHGHSLVLARPTYGEQSPQAWESSAVIGGSPGAADPVPAATEDLVRIAASRPLADPGAPGQVAMIALENLGPVPIDASGMLLESAGGGAVQAHILPTGTVVPAFGTIEVSPASFIRDPAGETLLLKNAAGTRVIDAAATEPAAAGQTWFRDDGAPGLICINQVSPVPVSGLEQDQWVEVRNASFSPADISGWRITGVIAFTFPPGTVLDGLGKIVVAKDVAAFTALYAPQALQKVTGPFSGALDPDGERLALRYPATIPGGTVYQQVDTVLYPPETDTTRGRTWRRIDPLTDGTVRENWELSTSGAASEFITVQTTGALDLNYPGITDVSQVQIFLMGEGEAVIDDVEVLDSGGVNRIADGTFTSGAQGGWVFQGNHERSSMSGGAMVIRAGGRGGPDGNRIRCPLTSNLTPGTSATIRMKARWVWGNPEIIIRLRGGWLEAHGRLPVPARAGQPWDVGETLHQAPVISATTVRPALPQPGQSQRVFARVECEDEITSIRLRYRIDPSTTFTEVTMLPDTDRHGPLTGSVFTARIPAQTAGTTVAWHITATNDEGRTRTWPTRYPVTEALTRWGETPQTNPFATYRMWQTAANTSRWASRDKFSNEPLDLTFVYGEHRVVYGARAYYGGSEATTPGYNGPAAGLCAYNLSMPDGVEVIGTDGFNLDWPVRDSTNQREQLMFWMCEQMDLPHLHRRFVNLYFNGVRRGVINDDVQRPNQDVLNEFYRSDNGGRLIKSNNYVEVNDAGTARLDPMQGNFLTHYNSGGQHKLVRYRWNWQPRATDDLNDFTEIFSLIDALNTAPAGYDTAVRARVNTTNWSRTFAMNDLCSFWDSFGNGNKKNTYLYKPELSGWELISWDFDVGLGVFNDPTDAALFSAGDPVLTTFQTQSAYRREYWRAMREALNTWFTGDSNGRLYQRLQQKWNALQSVPGLVSPFVASGAYPLSIPAWVNARRTFLLTQVNNAETGGAWSITTPANGATVFTNSITLSGRAPFTVASIRVNGLPLALSWPNVTTWSAPFVVMNGANALTITGHDHDGAVIFTSVHNLTSTAPTSWPALRFNEWMASNSAASGITDPADGASDDWIELRNPTAAAVSLAGWRISDQPGNPGLFTIPSGFSIPANGYLILWCDDSTFQNAPTTRPDLHVPFRLSAAGETLELTAPDGTRIDLVTFGPQDPDKTSGRWAGSGDSVVLLSSPTLGAANAFSPPAPEFTAPATLSPTGLTLTWRALPGATYQITRSTDLTSWPLAGTVTATSSTATFTVPVSPAEPRAFYRVGIVVP